MISRFKRFHKLLLATSHRRTVVSSLTNREIEFFVEICHNIVKNPRVLLSKKDFDCLSPVVSQISGVGAARRLDTAKPLLLGLSQNRLACIARVALNFTK